MAHPRKWTRPMIGCPRRGRNQLTVQGYHSEPAVGPDAAPQHHRSTHRPLDYVDAGPRAGPGCLARRHRWSQRHDTTLWPTESAHQPRRIMLAPYRAPVGGISMLVSLVALREIARAARVQSGHPRSRQYCDQRCGRPGAQTRHLAGSAALRLLYRCTIVAAPQPRQHVREPTVWLPPIAGSASTTHDGGNSPELEQWKFRHSTIHN